MPGFLRDLWLELRLSRCLRVWLVLGLCALASGCATGRNPQDPYESFNRGVFKVNDVIDKALIRPVAKGYKAVVPLPLRGGVGNFFANLTDVPSALNALLQGKFKLAANGSGRFLVNSTLGIFGVFDVASHVGLERQVEDFGQTLGYWGLGSGPYLVLPIVGPSSFRDAGGLIVDVATNPATWVGSEGFVSWGLVGTRIVHDRSNLFDAERILNEAALDKYSFLRDAYLQRREALVSNGAGAAGAPATKPRKSLKELEDELEEGEGSLSPADSRPAASQ